MISVARFYSLSLFILFLYSASLLSAQTNPFLRPGSKKPSAPIVQKSTPLPPKPIPHNHNLEFRGYFKLKGTWHFSVFDKSKKKGEWYMSGDEIGDSGHKINEFLVDKEVLVLAGGLELALHESDKSSLPLPVAKPQRKPQPAPFKVPPPNPKPRR